MQIGIVSTHAETIFLTIPHFTAPVFLKLPTPIIAVEIMWVVLTGIPKCEQVRMIPEAVISTANPSIGFILQFLMTLS